MEWNFLPHNFQTRFSVLCSEATQNLSSLLYFTIPEILEDSYWTPISWLRLGFSHDYEPTPHLFLL